MIPKPESTSKQADSSASEEVSSEKLQKSENSKGPVKRGKKYRKPLPQDETFWTSGASTDETSHRKFLLP